LWHGTEIGGRGDKGDDRDKRDRHSCSIRREPSGYFNGTTKF
jgi:hypothetical protein